MNITRFTGDLDVIASLADNPTQTASQLKAKFDEAAKSLGAYINGVLAPELESAIPAVVDNLTSVSAADALSANQGRELFAMIPAVADTLTGVSATDALSARQGNILSGALAGKQKTITSGTAAPSGGSNGDIYIQY